MTKGRMREFYQCDYDVAGVYDPMLPDAEVLVMAVQLLDKLDVGEYTIKVRMALDSHARVAKLTLLSARSTTAKF